MTRFDEWPRFPELPTEIFSMSFIRQTWMEPAATQLQMSLQNMWTGNLRKGMIQLPRSIFLGPQTGISFSFDGGVEGKLFYVYGAFSSITAR